MPHRAWIVTLMEANELLREDHVIEYKTGASGATPAIEL